MNAPGTHIRAVGTALPGPAISNAALTRRFGMPAAWEQWIETFVGTRTRHFAVDLDSGEVRHTVTDLCHTAGARALAAAGLRPSDIDLLVLGTSSPDQLMPATVNMVAERLGINEVAAFQLQSGCAGAVQALDLAQKLLESGRHRTALVLGADSCAKNLDVDIDAAALPPAEQINGVLFGDGAGALVLSTEPGPDCALLVHATTKLVGLGRPPGQIVSWRGRAVRDSDGPPVTEDYKAIEEYVPVLAAEALQDVLEELDWKDSDLDFLLPPQLSGRMTARITEHLDVPHAREVSCVVDTGNTGNALPFFQLQLALPLMAAGDRAVGVAVESSKWIKAGFALEKL